MKKIPDHVDKKSLQKGVIFQRCYIEHSVIVDHSTRGNNLIVNYSYSQLIILYFMVVVN